jgi:hypothetical protein
MRRKGANREMYPGSMEVATPVLSLMVNAFVQIFTFRQIKRIGLLRSIFIGFVAGMVSIFLMEMGSWHKFLYASRIDLVFILIVNIITYSMLGYCYFHFINLGETARRIRILRELYEHKEGLSKSEILKQYNAKEVLDNRMNRLVNNGQVILRNGRYYIGNRKMLLIANMIYSLREITFGSRTQVLKS